jgi:hypothetical protein
MVFRKHLSTSPIPFGEMAWDHARHQLARPPARRRDGDHRPSGAFCEVAARRLPPSESGLHVTGPDGTAILSALRTYPP